MICGNTVVLKCSEISPASQAIIVEVFEEVCQIEHCLVLEPYASMIVFDFDTGRPTEGSAQLHLGLAGRLPGSNG